MYLVYGSTGSGLSLELGIYVLYLHLQIFLQYCPYLLVGDGRTCITQLPECLTVLPWNSISIVAQVQSQLQIHAAIGLAYLC